MRVATDHPTSTKPTRPINARLPAVEKQPPSDEMVVEPIHDIQRTYTEGVTAAVEDAKIFEAAGGLSSSSRTESNFTQEDKLAFTREDKKQATRRARALLRQISSENEVRRSLEINKNLASTDASGPPTVRVSWAEVEENATSTGASGPPAPRESQGGKFGNL